MTDNSEPHRPRHQFSQMTQQMQQCPTQMAQALNQQPMQMAQQVQQQPTQAAQRVFPTDEPDEPQDPPA